MIQSLLDVARMRSGKNLPLNFENCDLAVEVDRMIEVQLLAERDRLIFTERVPIWGAWGVEGIRRAFDNLVTNAVKYGESDTPVEIKLKRKNDLALLSVHNRGPEIPAQEQTNVFLAFQRTSRSEASSKNGWGLGLALIKGVAEAHGGIVKLESSKNTGTTFTLELPIRDL